MPVYPFLYRSDLRPDTHVGSAPLYSPQQIFWAGFLGSPFAAIPLFLVTGHRSGRLGIALVYVVAIGAAFVPLLTMLTMLPAAMVGWVPYFLLLGSRIFFRDELAARWRAGERFAPTWHVVVACVFGWGSFVGAFVANLLVIGLFVAWRSASATLPP
jgi:hypothetical protein